MRSFLELINPQKVRVDKALGEVVKIKKTMKIRLRLHLKVVQYRVDAYNEIHSDYLDVTLTSKNPVEVNRHNYKEHLAELYKELDGRLSEFQIEGLTTEKAKKQSLGSGWVIHRYRSLVIDIFDINSVRGSSRIPTPENIQMLNVDLLILEMKIMSVLNGV